MNISSQDCGPQRTRLVASGLWGLVGELSKPPVQRTQVPAGTRLGVRGACVDPINAPGTTVASTDNLTKV